jgi:hypothetical protein
MDRGTEDDEKKCDTTQPQGNSHKVKEQTKGVPGSHDSGWLCGGSLVINIGTKALQITGMFIAG